MHSSQSCWMSVAVFFTASATADIYTLSLHDALPIWPRRAAARTSGGTCGPAASTIPRCRARRSPIRGDRKSTRLNSSHGYISYAVFCLKKKTMDTIAPHIDRLAAKLWAAYVTEHDRL